MYNFIIHHKRIREARYDHGLSISELGLVAGLTDEQVIGLENEKINNCFVEYDHRIDCVRRVADALGIDYDHFLQNIKNRISDSEISDTKARITKSDRTEYVSEFDDLNSEIAKSSISGLHNSEEYLDDRFSTETSLNDNLRSLGLFGPIMLIFLYLFYFLLNFV